MKRRVSHEGSVEGEEEEEVLASSTSSPSKPALKKPRMSSTRTSTTDTNIPAPVKQEDTAVVLMEEEEEEMVDGRRGNQAQNPSTQLSSDTSGALRTRGREAAVREATRIRTSEDKLFYALAHAPQDPRDAASPCASLLSLAADFDADVEVRVQCLQTLTNLLLRLEEAFPSEDSYHVQRGGTQDALPRHRSTQLQMVEGLRAAVLDLAHILLPHESQLARRQALRTIGETWLPHLPAVTMLPFSQARLQSTSGAPHSSASSSSASASSTPTLDAVFAPAALFRILERALDDPDPRVRAEALTCAARLEGQTLASIKGPSHGPGGLRFPLSFYLRVRTMMTDDSEDVRIAMLNVLAALSNHDKNVLVDALLGTEQRRLVDDAFVCICDMVNDLSPLVRTTASRLLGAIEGVGEDYLMQTFDKKLMSHLRRRTSEHEEIRKKYRRVARTDNTNPEGDEDVAQMSLMSTGACGAFVHGLEDEFYEVREAAVDSIARLSEECIPLAEKALDFLVDMFNDDIDSVRVLAIQALTRLARSVVFREEQLELMLSILEDNSEHIRSCTHTLLGLARLGNYVCLNVVVQSLFANLRKYPLDYASVWRAMHGLGKNHPEFSEFLIESLLRLDFHFAQAEPRVDDHGYIAVLVLVFNACTGNPRIMALLPEFVERHHGYLQRKYPDLVPPLKFGAVILPSRLADRIPPLPAAEVLSPPTAGSSRLSSTSAAQNLALGASNHLSKAMDSVVGCGGAIQEGRLEIAERVLATAERELQQVIRFDKAHADTAIFYLSYAKWIRLYAQARRALATSGQLNANAANLGLHLYVMQNHFSGFSRHVHGHLQVLKLHAHVLLTLFRLQSTPSDDLDVSAIITVLLSRCEAVERHLVALSLDAHESVGRLRDALLGLQLATADQLKNLCWKAVEDFKLSPVMLEGPLKRRMCKFIKPDRRDVKARSVFTLLPLEEEVEVVVRTLESAPCRESIRIHVTYPDGSVRVVAPSQVKVLEEDTSTYLVHCKLLLSANPWTEAAPVKIALLYRFNLDIEGDDLLDVPFKAEGDHDENAFSLDASVGGLVLAETSIMLAPTAKARNM